MSFLRNKKIKGGLYQYIQQSIRIGDTVKSRHVAYVGGGKNKKLNVKLFSLPRPSKKVLTPEQKKNIELITAMKRQVFADKENRHKIKATERLLRRGLDTETIHFNKDKGEYHGYRQNLHDEIIDELVDKPGAVAKKGIKPEVILLGGAAGSGKSAVILKKIPDYEKRYVVLDSDFIKSQLPEYKGYNAGIVHEESSHVFEKAFGLAIENNMNIILDATLKSTDKAKKKIETLRDAGYYTKVFATNVDVGVNTQRATDRFLKKGRYVPMELIVGSTEIINKSVRDVATDADEYKVWDTSKFGVENAKVVLEGRSPSLKY